MDYRQLQVFIKVVESHNLTVAAKEMGITQPAVSGILKKLEAELGVVLFYHVGKMLIPNENGKILYGMAQNIRYSNDLVRHNMHNTEHKKSNIVVTLTTFSDHFFQITGNFSAQFPCVSFMFRPGTYLTQDHRLSTSDFFLLFEHEVQEEETMVLDVQERLYAILPRNHPLAGEMKVSLYELRDEDFIFVKNTLEAGYEKSYEECIFTGFTPRIFMTVDTAMIKYAAIASGLGIGLVYSNESALAKQIRNCVYIPLIGNFHIRPICLAWYPERLNATATSFLQFIRNYRRK